MKAPAAEIARFVIALSVVIAVLLWAQAGGGMTWDPISLSLRVALSSTLWSLGVGIALAVLLTWKRLPASDLFDAVVAVPLVLPPTVLGIPPI